jgi:hypothetical protein
VAQVLPDTALAHGPEAIHESGHLGGLGEQPRQRREIRQARARRGGTTAGGGGRSGLRRFVELLNLGRDAAIA